MTTNSGLIFIKNNPFLSAAIALIILYIASLIPGNVWLFLLFVYALTGRRQ
jgi:hypothetical protein